jgi:hypothetical protein
MVDKILTRDLRDIKSLKDVKASGVKKDSVEP